MNIRVRIEDNTGFGVLRDASLKAPSEIGTSAELRERLKVLAHRGDLFLLDNDDPIEFNLQLVMGEPVPDTNPPLFEQVGGSFFLSVPTGEIVASGWSAWLSGQKPSSKITLPPGPYAVLVHSRREFDSAEYDKVMGQIVGDNEVAHRHKVDELGCFGCLAIPVLLIASLVTFLLSFPRALCFAFLLLAALACMPHLVMRRSAKYRKAEKGIFDYEASLPIYYIELKPLELGHDLVGGFFKIV